MKFARPAFAASGADGTGIEGRGRNESFCHGLSTNADLCRCCCWNERVEIDGDEEEEEEELEEELEKEEPEEEDNDKWEEEAEPPPSAAFPWLAPLPLPSVLVAITSRLVPAPSCCAVFPVDDRRFLRLARSVRQARSA